MTHTTRIIDRISAVDAASWDACNGGDNPFTRHAFLNALEVSGCVRAETGWMPQHIIAEDKSGNISGVMPLYMKSHSYGEYVFDHSWANAYEQAGGRYYPKLQSCAPFSPVTGPRLLIHPQSDTENVGRALLNTAIARAEELNLSSLHITFMREDQWAFSKSSDFLQRVDQQFHWENRGYRHFDDFLEDLSSRKRKNIRKERREALAHDIKIEILSGDQITEAHWDAYFQFYLDTANRKWGQPYLNRAFFSAVGAAMADQIVLMLCKRSGHYIAGALNFKNADTLYGRYWGCIEDHRFLHFEVCYYQAIDYAIQHGLKRVEAGAQGEHKLARGYLPHKTYSAHWVRDPGFRAAVARFLDQERTAVDHQIDILDDYSPFKKAP